MEDPLDWLDRERRFIRIRPGEAVSLECPYCNGEMFEANHFTWVV